MVNEDTIAEPGGHKLYARVRQGGDHLVYISPEMALSDAFVSIWQDTKFRTRLQAVIIDEAHCIVEWGDSFREAYKQLGRIRNYTGNDVPFVACTATCSTEAFDVIWNTLGFGMRPFWGLDAGCDRDNLFYLIRPLVNAKNPIIDALNVLPTEIPNDASPECVPKCLFYFESIKDCKQAVDTLRQCLPPHLRGLVQTFKSTGSKAYKQLAWERFRDGQYRILCCTDAVGMGCNVPDVQFVGVFGVGTAKQPVTISVLSQRWGRAGRKRSINATCFLFVPPWLYRPKPLPHGVPVPVFKSGKNAGQPRPLEPKTHTERRAKVDSKVVELVNLGHDEEQPGACTLDCWFLFCYLIAYHYRLRT